MSRLWIKNFPSLLSSLFISKVGDYAYEVVFVFIVLEVTENNYLFTGLVYFFRFILFLFFGTVGGWMADNGCLKRNLLFSEWGRLFVSFLLFLTYLSGRADIFILIIASVVTTIGWALFQPSFQTAVPQIVADKDLARANSITHVAEETASIIGPLICSLILFVADKAWVLFFNGLTYSISILFLITIGDFQQQSSVSFRLRQVY
ncbi:MFS transporter [Bartonella rattaustraliani]|uniref:MFS transporter n=1 Tax=Bartonella rattaustraliani TaxID=481139 RepID=UPI00030808D7|nr:MFS transporter [Bartonella rattaustraliani]